MNLYDPSRPLMGDLPTLLEINMVVPGFYVKPLPDDRVELMMMVPSGFNRAAPKYLKINEEELLIHLHHMREDPEEYLRVIWNYRPETFEIPPVKPSRAKAQSLLSDELLANLNLDDLLK